MVSDTINFTKAVIEEIFEKDIKKRVKIRNVEVFEAVRGFVVNNFGATMSIQSLQHSLEKVGLSVQRATLKRYIDALVGAKILYQLYVFTPKYLTGQVITATILLTMWSIILGDVYEEK